MAKLDEFTVLFHSINGDTVKERTRNFNKFLQSLNSNITNEEEFTKLIKTITPNTTLEEIFRIEIIIQSKSKKLLLDELKTCNEIFVKKLLKNWKLFEEIFLNITENDLIMNILPYLSYSLKFKILNGIRKNIKNEELLDEYFAAVEKRYGLRTAASILPGCSMSLIKSKTEKFHLKLPQSHLKGIFRKERQFVEFYFDILKRKYENMNLSVAYFSTLRYIAKVDPSLYWKLHDKFELTVRFGKHMTPNMIKIYKNIFKKGREALRDDTFHFLKMFKFLKKEGTLNSFLLSLCPESHHKFKDEYLTYSSTLRFIRKGPVSQQYHLVSLAFSEKYKKNLLEYPNYFTERLLKMTPIKERESVLDHLVLHNEKLYYLYGTAISIPRFKKQLQHSSDISSRSNYALSLCRSCMVNKDEVALLNVLCYVLNRHSNDEGFLTAFIDGLVDWPNIKSLSEEHWQYIARIYRLVSPSQSWSARKFVEHHLCHLIKYNKPIKYIIKKQIKDIIKEDRYAFQHIYDTEYQKEYCDEIVKCLESYKGHGEFKMPWSYFFSYLEYLEKYKKVSVLDYVQYFDHLGENEFMSFNRTKHGFDKYNNESVHRIFWKPNGVVNNRCILWYAEHRPDLLRENVHKLSIFVDMRKIDIFLRKFKKFCDPDIVEEIKTYALDKIQNKNYSKAIFSVRAISILDPDSFLEMITSLLPPSGGKINLKETTAEKLNLQKEIAKGLSNVHILSKSIPMILKFCIGDYLKFGLRSLYKIVYNMPELQIKNYLSTLPNTDVSIRKHILSLSKNLLTKDDFYEVLSDWSQKDTNLSMRNILLKNSIKYFIENPSNQTWCLLNNNLKSRNADDRKIYDFLLKFEKISLDDLPKYLKIVYEAISSNSDPKINEKKIQLINAIPNGIIKELDESFLKQIIKDAAFIEHSTNFCWKCVFYANEDHQSVLIDENFEELKRFVQENNIDLKQNDQIRSKITTFFYDFINLAVELKQNLEYIQKIMLMWTSFFDNEHFSKELMLIRFIELYFKSEFNVYQTGLEINKLLYEYINKFNSSIIESYCIQVRRFLQITSIKQNQRHLLKFVDGVFHDKKDEHIYNAIMYFLPNALPKLDDEFVNYIPIITAIENCDSLSVQYHFDDYLSDKSDNG